MTIADRKPGHKLSYPVIFLRQMAVVLTERMKPELMTCHDIVATGRYPYTGQAGNLEQGRRAESR